jgi:putative transposase
MTAVCETLGVARSNIARRVVQGPSKRRGRPALSEELLLSEIMDVIAEMPSYGYPRVWVVLRRRSEARGDAPVDVPPAFRTV